MTPSSPAPVDIQTSPHDVPSIPPWFAELILLVRHFTQRGILEAIAQQVHLGRGRAGAYDVIDFVAILLGYALSGEPTLEAFFERLSPFADPFMALFGRDQRPTAPLSAASSPTSTVPAWKPCASSSTTTSARMAWRASSSVGSLTSKGTASSSSTLTPRVKLRASVRSSPLPSFLSHAVGWPRPVPRATSAANGVRSCAPAPPCPKPIPSSGWALSQAPAMVIMALNSTLPVG